jgi:hypothetical protein
MLANEEKIGLQKNEVPIFTLDLMDKFRYQRVGSGEQKNSLCGKFMGHIGCLREDLHNIVTLDGVSYSGKVFIKRVYHSCDRPECPICFRRWAVKEAGAAEERLKCCMNRFGDAEHVIVSCPKSEYVLPFDKLKDKALKAFRARGGLGGFLIFHAQRYHHANEAYVGEPAHWFYAPHFHILGFLDGGYGACRSCKKSKIECWNCKGFEGVTRRLNLTDGYIVKVKGARKTFFGTLYYQLNHSTIVKRKVRSHIGTWFGVCSYTKLKLKKSDRKKKSVCPICGHDLVPVKYVGEGEPNSGQWWIEEFEDDYLDERGVPKWIEIVKGRSYYE